MIQILASVIQNVVIIVLVTAAFGWPLLALTRRPSRSGPPPHPGGEQSPGGGPRAPGAAGR